MDDVEKTIATYDKIAASYCPKTRLNKYLKWEEEYVKRQLAFINVKNPLVLDVGCGDGRHCLLFEKNGARAIGIDLSGQMIAEARKYFPKGDFRTMDMRRLDFDDGTFDGIWASGSIYHVSKNDLAKVLSEFRRVLKNDAVLAISFKLGEGEGLEANPKSYGGSPRYFAYYSKEEILAKLREYRFGEVESCLYPENVFGDKILQIWLRLKKV
jgi:ubiquinone/menaquinone biosynthesis C-methylase UbiE